MAETNIEWTNRVWNPVRGCTRVSEGCRNCYAERQAIRQSKPGQPYHGLVLSHQVTRGDDVRNEPRWTGKIALDEEKLSEPLRWRKPSFIFVNSMSDLFHPDVPDAFIDMVLAVIACSPQHTFQVLTKRPERMLEYFQKLQYEGIDERLSTNCAWHPEEGDTYDDDFSCRVSNSINGALGDGFNVGWPMKNLWLGVSVENLQTLARIPFLLDTPAAKHWISAEPLLGPLDLGYYTVDHLFQRGHVPALDWVVVGGESGPGARPCNVEWIREIVRDCKAAGIPVFVKQLGAAPFLHRQSSGETKLPGGSMRYSSLELETSIEISDLKGGQIRDFPSDIQVRQYPEVR